MLTTFLAVGLVAAVAWPLTGSAAADYAQSGRGQKPNPNVIRTDKQTVNHIMSDCSTFAVHGCPFGHTAWTWTRHGPDISPIDLRKTAGDSCGWAPSTFPRKTPPDLDTQACAARGRVVRIPRGRRVGAAPLRREVRRQPIKEGALRPVGRRRHRPLHLPVDWLSVDFSRGQALDRSRCSRP